MTRVEVDPGAFSTASRVVGESVAHGVDDSWTQVARVLGGCGSMAGSDPLGVRWAAAYDEVAASAARASQDVVNGCLRLAGLLEQTGFNYGWAESASTAGAVRLAVVDRRDYSQWSVMYAAPLSAVGSGVGEPPGWSLIRAAVDYVWPNGHQDVLRRAAAGWATAAQAMEVMAAAVPGAIASIELQHAPEIGAAVASCAAMRAHIDELAATYAALGRACADLAATLDEAHSRVIAELVSLVKWSVAIQIGAGALAGVTFGLAEALGQGYQFDRIAATAARVSAIIAHGIELAGSTADAIADLLPRVSAVSTDLSVLLDTRLVQVSVKNAGSMAMTARREQIAAGELKQSAAIRSTWGNLETLDEHFLVHAKDFGITSRDEYVRDAHEFFLRAGREHLPTKVDTDGTIRMYDPKTNSFGVYRRDGTTRSYYKPRRRSAYWNDQPGKQVKW